MAFTSSAFAVTPTLNYEDRYLNGRRIYCSFICSSIAKLLPASGLNEVPALVRVSEAD